MALAGLEPTISASERPQNYALDRAATGTGYYQITGHLNLLPARTPIQLQNYCCLHTVKYSFFTS